MTEKNIEEALKDGVWAIVSTAASKYVGQLLGLGNRYPASSKEYFTNRIGETLVMRWPLEYSCHMIPRPARTSSGEQVIMFDRNIQVNSIGHCLDVAELTIHVTPVDVIFFEDMSPKDRRWHEEMVVGAVRDTLTLRAREAGILDPRVQ